MPPLNLEPLRPRAADSEMNKTCYCKFNTNNNKRISNVRIAELKWSIINQKITIIVLDPVEAVKWFYYIHFLKP